MHSEASESAAMLSRSSLPDGRTNTTDSEAKSRCPRAGMLHGLLAPHVGALVMLETIQQGDESESDIRGGRVLDVI